MHHSPLVALQQPGLEPDPSLGCSCCWSCPGLGPSQPHSPIPAQPSETSSVITGWGLQMAPGSSFKVKQLWTFSVLQGTLEPLRSHPALKVRPHLEQGVDPVPRLPDQAVAPFQALLALLQAQH